MTEKAEFYNNVYRLNPRKWANIERDYIAFRALNEFTDEPASMLDYGCGNGHTIALFYSQWPGTQFTGVDISDVALDIAREHVPWADFHDFVPPFLRWNVITIMGVAEHFEDPAEELRRISQAMTEDGYMYLEVPNCLAYSPDKTEGFRKTHAGADQLEWHWRRETWEQALANAGLEIVKGYTGPTPAWEYIWILRRE